MQSGTSLSPWALSYEGKETAMRVAEKLGIKATDTADLVQKLAELPTHDVVKTSIELENSAVIFHH